MRQKKQRTIRSFSRLTAVAIAILVVTCWPGHAAQAQSVIDMPPPRPASVQVESKEAAATATDVGNLAIDRYGYQRAGATSTYGMYHRRYNRSWPYSYGYPVGYYGYGFGHPWYGCYGGASIRHIGGGRFVGTLLYR